MSDALEYEINCLRNEQFKPHGEEITEDVHNHINNKAMHRRREIREERPVSTINPYYL